MSKNGTRRLGLAATLLALALGGAAVASAGQPNGLKGYEGQPGNQGGSQHNGNNNGNSNGLRGYEGQPGNQGGH